MAGIAGSAGVVFATSFVPAAALHAKGRNRRGARIVQERESDSKCTILPTTLQNIPRLDENIDCFGEVFSLQLPDCSGFVDPDLFLLKRFFQRNVAASINLVACVEKKNCKIFGV